MGELYEAVASLNNLMEAWLWVSRRASAGGADRMTANQVERDLQAQLGQLEAELRSYRYAPLPARQVFIPKSGKPDEERELRLPALRDKIVQQAVRQVIEPLFERAFLDCSYAYRQRKGAHRAVRRLLHELDHRKSEWVVRSDIDDFFDTISHERLLRILEDTVHDADVLRLIRLFVSNGVLQARGQLIDPPAGVPTGSVLAPLLSNAYLHGFDEYLRRHSIAHVRYADDWVIVAADRQEAEQAAEIARRFLVEERELRLDAKGEALAEVRRGFRFLGFWIRSGKLAIDRSKLDNIERQLRLAGEQSRNGLFSDLLTTLREMAAGWTHYYGIVHRREDLEYLDQRIAAFVGREVARRSAAGEEEPEGGWELPLEGFPWPGAQPGVAMAHVVESLAAEREQLQRDARAGQAARRQRRRALGLAAERSEIVVWRKDAVVARAGNRLLLRDGNGRKLLERPISQIRLLLVQGKSVSVRSDALELCAESEVTVSFLSRKGRAYAIVHNPGSERVELLTRQLEAARSRLGAEIAVALAQAKVKNQANFLRYVAKYRRRSDPAAHHHLRGAVEKARAEGKALGSVLAGFDESGEWRGKVFAAEGRAAEAYWEGVKRVLDRVPFAGRERKGAKDPINSALNYGYAILYGRIEVAILKAGLHSGIGFLHTPGRQRPALAFDLIEPFRAPVVDRTVLAMATRREPLEVDGSGRLTDRSRRALAANVLERWRTETPYREGFADYESILEDQLEELARALQGKASFRPFLQRW